MGERILWDTSEEYDFDIFDAIELQNEAIAEQGGDVDEYGKIVDPGPPEIYFRKLPDETEIVNLCYELFNKGLQEEAINLWEEYGPNEESN